MVNAKVVVLGAITVASALVAVLQAQSSSVAGATLISATGSLTLVNGVTGDVVLSIDRSTNTVALEWASAEETYQVVGNQLRQLDSEGASCGIVSDKTAAEAAASLLGLSGTGTSTISEGGAQLNIESIATGSDALQGESGFTTTIDCPVELEEDERERRLVDEDGEELAHEGMDYVNKAVARHLNADGFVEESVEYDFDYIMAQNLELNRKLEAEQAEKRARQLETNGKTYDFEDVEEDSKDYGYSNDESNPVEWAIIGNAARDCSSYQARRRQTKRDEKCCGAEGWSLLKWYYKDKNAFSVCVKNNSYQKRVVLTPRGSDNVANWVDNFKNTLVMWEPTSRRRELGESRINHPAAREHARNVRRQLREGSVGEHKWSTGATSGVVGGVISADDATVDTCIPTVGCKYHLNTYVTTEGFAEQYDHIGDEILTVNDLIPSSYSGTRFIIGFSMATSMAAMAIIDGFQYDKMRTWSDPRTFLSHASFCDDDGFCNAITFDIDDPPSDSDIHISYRHKLDQVSMSPPHEWTETTKRHIKGTPDEFADGLNSDGIVEMTYHFQHVSGRSWRLTGEPKKNTKAERDIEMVNMCKSGVGESNFPTNDLPKSMNFVDLIAFMVGVKKVHGAPKVLIMANDLFGDFETYDSTTCHAGSASSDPGL